ncbi:hypothetical protein MCBG_05793 [Micromonospora sp. M42]|uniref:maleylpyruvate isomerase family mycothiol-dependent enzyme n=1 Tax=Micromonospora sp. M42 TaxID=457406 RepID=UPI0003EED6B4|nr:maleylpyruvate isomerase family mycothiol-dependent enzyme [Micromonospora sp. M42]EWM68659.1 hypothetical protein MCBG_05793 [Micromonospora sp. M42]
MTTDPLLLTGPLAEANDRLLRTVSGLTAADVAAPSLLPGWSRAHVLTHLARNADGFVNLLTSARTGEDIPMYASAQARAADIDAGADRGPADLLDDVRRSGQRFDAAVAAMPVDAWGATVQTRRGPWPAAMLVWAGCARSRSTTSTWRPVTFRRTGRRRSPSGCCTKVVTGLSGNPAAPAMVLRFDGAASELVVGDPEGAPTVTGPAPELAAWLTGRGAGELLTVDPDGPLPNPPEWI